jgi:dipeptidyl aminopeptidase/acylaminoacyl peptidase
MRGSAVIDRPTEETTRPLDPEILIKEARHRTRRRRAGYALGVGLIIAGVLVALISGSGSQAPLVRVTPSSPLTVNAAALRDHGRLAFVSKGSLYVLNGPSGRLRHLALPGHTASNPSFSHDGRWLAYLELPVSLAPGTAESPDGGGGYRLWIARADGSDAHEMPALRNTAMVGWSPTTDTLAVIEEAPGSATCRSSSVTTVSVVTPPAIARTVYTLSGACGRPAALYGVVWSPDGRSLAIANTSYRPTGGSRVFSIDLASRTRRTWFAIRNSQALPAVCSATCSGKDVIADLVGWWRGRGIGFSVLSSGMTFNPDGSPLEFVRVPGAAPQKAGEVLSDGAQTSVAVSRSGRLAVVDAADRDIGSSGTEVKTCGPGSIACVPVPGAETWNQTVHFSCQKINFLHCPATRAAGSVGSGVTLDPAWSPDGSRLLFVRGPASPAVVILIAQWLGDHRLFVYNSATGKARPLPGTSGASAPQWAADGKSVLYVARDSLWLLGLKSGRATRIAGPLFGGASLESADLENSYFYQVPFRAQFAWSS